MKYNPQIHHRRSIRLKGYDYSQAGLYFITMCVQNRAHLFGKILSGEMLLNNAGKMIDMEWLKLTERFANIQLHEFIAMPNHFHGIIEITQNDPVRAPLVGAQKDSTTLNREQLGKIGSREEEGGQPQGIAPTIQPQGIAPTIGSTITSTDSSITNKTIGDIIGAFKSITTVEYIRGVKELGWPTFNGKLWQRDYYEHIIRDERSYKNISEYIINNPVKCQGDKFFK